MGATAVLLESPTLQRLKALSALLAPTTECGQRDGLGAAFLPLGLFLLDDAATERYEVTPINARPLASARCDGVHFSFLLLDGRSLEQSPIVMTDPMDLGGPWNYVVGESLLEFLALGSMAGFNALIELSGDRIAAVARIEKGPAENWTAEEQGLLDALRAHFKLNPWTDTAARLNNLDSMYRRLIRLSDTARCWLSLDA